jgi:hypothetical protein
MRCFISWGLRGSALLAGVLAMSVFPLPASGQNVPMFRGSLQHTGDFTEDFYDNMVTGVAKMLMVGAILSSPVVADRVIYFGSTDGNLYALM